MISINKVIVYLFLLLLYFGLSKVISPTGLNIKYVHNDQTLEQFFVQKPISVILVDFHSTGTIIKTHYHKYRVVYGFQSFEEKIVRVSNSFKKKYSDSVGLSIFRRDQLGNASFSKLIPGSIFVGDTSFGNWQKNKDGSKTWKFYRVYRHLVDFLGWNEFRPNYKDYQAIQVSINQNKDYKGKEVLFGTQGKLTPKAFPTFFQRKTPTVDYKKIIFEYFKENYYKENKVSI